MGASDDLPKPVQIGCVVLICLAARTPVLTPGRLRRHGHLR